MSQDQLDVLDELGWEIEACTDPEEREELERTQKVCREFAYAMAEGFMTAEEIGGELYFSKA